MSTSSVPGTHGATVAGTQGMGVSTPRAADVAEATSGLANEEHIPKVGTLTIGAKSIMVAAGILLVKVRFVGRTTNEAGATPKEQVIIAPIHTCSGMVKVFYWI